MFLYLPLKVTKSSYEQLQNQVTKLSYSWILISITRKMLPRDKFSLSGRFVGNFLSVSGDQTPFLATEVYRVHGDPTWQFQH